MAGSRAPKLNDDQGDKLGRVAKHEPSQAMTVTRWCAAAIAVLLVVGCGHSSGDIYTYGKAPSQVRLSAHERILGNSLTLVEDPGFEAAYARHRGLYWRVHIDTGMLDLSFGLSATDADVHAVDRLLISTHRFDIVTIEG